MEKYQCRGGGETCDHVDACRRDDNCWAERGRHPIRLAHRVNVGSISGFLSEIFVFLCMFTGCGVGSTTIVCCIIMLLLNT